MVQKALLDSDSTGRECEAFGGKQKKEASAVGRLLTYFIK
jgi:hypothetical protein